MVEAAADDEDGEAKDGVRQGAGATEDALLYEDAIGAHTTQAPWEEKGGGGKREE